MSHLSGPAQVYQSRGAARRAPSAVMLELHQLTASEAARVELRAQHIYGGLPPFRPWSVADELTKDEFRRRALRLMLFDGSLMHGVRPGAEDYGYAELKDLDAEVAAVVRGELRAGELWRPESEDGGADRGY